MRRPDTDDTEVPLASLIDIVFLLIIFFVVTSSIDKEAMDEAVKLADSYHVAPVQKRDPRTVTVNIRHIAENDAEINIGKVPLSLPTLGAVLNRTRQRYGQDVPVVIRSDGRVKFAHVDTVMKTATEAGLYRIRFSSRDRGSN